MKVTFVREDSCLLPRRHLFSHVLSNVSLTVAHVLAVLYRKLTAYRGGRDRACSWRYTIGDHDERLNVLFNFFL